MASFNPRPGQPLIFQVAILGISVEPVKFIIEYLYITLLPLEHRNNTLKMAEERHEKFEAPCTIRMLKNPSLGFFNHESGKRGFPLPSFSMAYSH